MEDTKGFNDIHEDEQDGHDCGVHKEAADDLAGRGCRFCGTTGDFLDQQADMCLFGLARGVWALFVHVERVI